MSRREWYLRTLIGSVLLGLSARTGGKRANLRPGWAGLGVLVILPWFAHRAAATALARIFWSMALLVYTGP